MEKITTYKNCETLKSECIPEFENWLKENKYIHYSENYYIGEDNNVWTVNALAEMYVEETRLCKRKINITFEIEDNDLIIYKFETELRKQFNNSIIDYRIFPKTEHLKENESFKKLVKAKREAGLVLDRFINDNR